jgi:hypothetical protein
LVFIPGAKIKSQDLLLHPRILHRIIVHNILPKKRCYDEVIFMDMCLIDCMIREHCINLPYIMMKNIIVAHDQKEKSLLYNQCLTVVF